MGNDKIKHLYWRAGFGLSPAEWQERQDWSVSKAVDALFQEATRAKPLPIAQDNAVANFRPQMMDKEKVEEMLKQEFRKTADHNTDWIKRMASPAESALLERMSLFWHGHFACKPRFGKLAVQQLNTIRTHALGNFRDLVVAIAKDPGMIRYLNNQQNRKDSPNENFARELMELFTIGRGNYTENDIKEAARAFTGWSSTLAGEYVFRQRLHDYGKKTFFGKTGNFDGEDIIDIILKQRETADFITRKIYRYFVNAEVNESIVHDLSDQFYRSNYDIGKLMRSIFKSDWFYDPNNIGTKIKSPTELLAGMMRALDVRLENDLSLLFVQRILGQTLFNPPNVAGWPGGKSWIDNSTLMVRLNLAMNIIHSSEVEFQAKEQAEEPELDRRARQLVAQVNWLPLAKLTNNRTDVAAVETLADYLLQTPVVIGADKLRKAVNLSGEADFLRAATAMVMALPEYQMG